MASALIRLMVDPVTNKRTITIAHTSDADALPHEHEESHRELVEKLMEGGIMKPGDTLHVERGATGQLQDLPETTREPEHVATPT